MRSAVRAESMAALPPPITATLRPSRTGSSFATASRKSSAGITPFSSVPGRYTHASFQVPMARKTALYWLSRSFSVMSVPTATPQTNFDAHAPDQLHLAADHFLGQAVLGQGVAQHAAGLGIGFVDASPRGPSSAR